MNLLRNIARQPVPIILMEAAMSLLAISLLIQIARSPGPVQTVERMGPITVPADPLPCSDNDSLKLAAVRNPSIVCQGVGR